MRFEAAGGFAGLAEPWATVMIGVIAVVVIGWLAVVVHVLTKVVRSRIDSGMKVVWFALIMSSQPIGVLLWFLVGQPRANHVAR